jgi:hypothetical protein
LLPSDVVFNLTGSGATVRQDYWELCVFRSLQVVGSQVTVSDSLVNGQRIRGVAQMGVATGYDDRSYQAASETTRSGVAVKAGVGLGRGP